MNDRSLFGKLGRGATWCVLCIGALMMLIPFYIMLTMALKSPDDLATSTYLQLPRHLEWGNFLKVLSNPNVSFPLFFRNTAFIAISVTTGVVLTSALVAFPFARLEFDGKNRLFTLLLSTMMLPGIVTMIPNYVLFRYLHWIDTYNPLIIPAFFGGGAYNIFLMRQFFLSIPKDLDEAAVLDGASNAVTFWRVILPLAKPALATVGVFTFVGTWQDFMGPLIYINDPDKQTLEVGLRNYQSLAGAQYHLVMAASVMVTLPLIILFFLTQRFFVKGIVMSGIK
jgi:ABC-type glycerol-3-phosphate transport system permease component